MEREVVAGKDVTYERVRDDVVLDQDRRGHLCVDMVVVLDEVCV